MAQYSTRPNRRFSANAFSLSLLSALFLAAGCSTAPKTPQSSSSPHFIALSKTADADAFQPEHIDMPPDWLTIESTVVSEGEQDLFNRIRSGFGLLDVDHPSIDREENWFANHPDYLDRTFRRGERYLYYIVSELEERNMPRELALLPIVESAFIPDALSHAKAAGLWQFIPSTGLRYGLKQNNYYDGRRDVVESTRAALDYLQFLGEEFEGDWLLAIAAYNAGELNVSRAVERNRAKNKPTDFFSLDLPKETKAYVPKLLAMRRIVNEPARYGLEFGQLDNEPYFVKVDVGGQIDLDVAVDLAGMTKEDFLALNPGFKRRFTDPEGPFHLLIPVENEEKFLQKLASLPPDKRVPMVTYRVRKGETLKSIAAKTGMTVDELRSFNKLNSNSVKPGQELLLQFNTPLRPNSDALAAHTKSAKRKSIYTVHSGETLWSIAKSQGVDVDALAALNSIAASGTLSVGQKLMLPGSATLASAGSAKTLEPLTYTVRKGDTLAHIAGVFHVQVNQILGWNKLPSAAAIKAGQRLVLYVDDTRRLGG